MMKISRCASIAAVLAFSTAACDPGFWLTLRQPLRPAPENACVARTLSTSRFVTNSVPLAENGFGVTLRDEAQRTWSATLELSRPRADSVRVASIRYAYLLYERPGPSEEPGMVAAAAGLLRELRAACAPASAPAIECTSQGAPVPACATVREETRP
jgi:hypothetical protein